VIQPWGERTKPTLCSRSRTSATLTRQPNQRDNLSLSLGRSICSTCAFMASTPRAAHVTACRGLHYWYDVRSGPFIHDKPRHFAAAASRDARSSRPLQTGRSRSRLELTRADALISVPRSPFPVP